ncbi:MAG: hypothetical protein HC842_01235 [Cytophagales bacterium]|nr:hypothetical protein [Cytophagales bacterium]
MKKNGVVGNDSYEIHNPAYVSAMVWHYFERTADTAFLQHYFPIMEGVWEFYTHVIHANDKGTFDINHHHSAGQDEASQLDSSRNLLCASYSAEYSALNYQSAAQIVGGARPELLARAQVVLQAGLERRALLTEHGYYATYEGDERPKNSQKHPVQLNAITFCPMPERLNRPLITAWQKRYDLTSEARKPISHGWTYAAFALASSRMGSPEALASDLSAAQYCAHADPRWIQFYEFTFWQRWTLSTAYYFPTHGLYQQAITDALVQDWRDTVDVFACLLPTWEQAEFSFHGLHTLNGVAVSGQWYHGKYRLVLTAPTGRRVVLRVMQGQGQGIHIMVTTDNWVKSKKEKPPCWSLGLRGR